jgi:hypothetical protein
MRRALALLVLLLSLTLVHSASAGAGEESPHPVLMQEADPVANPARVVPDGVERDPDGILRVTGARWDDTTDPMRLVWQLRARGGRTIDCADCYYLAPHVRSFVATLVSQPWSRDLTTIEGFDPRQRGAGQHAGSGWAVTLVGATDARGFPTSAARQTLDRGLHWLLACDDEPCRSQRLGLTEVAHANRRWSVPTCARPIRAARPTLLVHGYEATIHAPDVSDDVVRFENRRTYAGALFVALPERTLRYRTEGGTTVVDGTRPTDCPERG